MRIAIHQPNFFPWYPFFQKMEAVDKFVLLTHCQFEKGGYQNRFNIGEEWYTMSVEGGMIPIREKKYSNAYEDFYIIKKRLTPYEHILYYFDRYISSSLHYTNAAIIFEIRNILRIKTDICYDYPTKLKSTDRLVDICKSYGATTYLAGPSGAKYMDFHKFEEAGIKVEFQTNQTTRPILEVIQERI